MMKPLILATLALSSLAASAMSFKAQIQPLKLPLMISTSQPPKVKFTPPGEIAIGLMRMCGDGDVANFEDENPQFNFVPQSVNEMHVMIGYWVVPTDATNFVPTPANFYPIGYRKNPIAEDENSIQYQGKFLPMNKSFSPGPNGLNLLATEILNLQKIAKESYGSDKDFRIFAGASTCINPSNASTLVDAPTGGFSDSDYKPSPVEILHTLTTTSNGHLYSVAETAAAELGDSNFNPNSFKNQFKKVKASKGGVSQSIYTGNTSYYAPVNNKPYSYEIGNGQGTEIKDSIMNLVIEIANLQPPTLTATSDADKLVEYTNTMKALTIYNKISSIDSFSDCKNDVNLNLNLDGVAGKYNWEPFPMNLSCKYLLNGNELANKVKALFEPTSLPDAGAFKNLQVDIAKRFFIGGVYEAAQAELQASVVIERPNCFNTSGVQKVIHRLVGSYPFEFKRILSTKTYQINASPHNHVHPEPLFALVDYTRYFNEDVWGVWGQVLPAGQTVDPAAWGMTFPIKTQDWNDHKIEDSTFNGVPINIKFNIRSVGGTCPMYC